MRFWTENERLGDEWMNDDAFIDLRFFISWKVITEVCGISARRQNVNKKPA